MTNPNQTSAFGIKDAMRNSGEPDLHEKNLANGEAPNNEGAEKKPSELDIALTRKWEAEARFIKTAKTRKELADAELSDWKALEADSQIGKIAAETHFISEPQTKKTFAEADLAEARKLEALAEIKRLEVERLRLVADVERVKAERAEREANTKFIAGASTYKTRMEGHQTKFQMVGQAASSIFVAIGVCVLAYIVLSR